MMKCQYCQKEITRKRGNLSFMSLQRAIKALFDAHVRKHKIDHSEDKTMTAITTAEIERAAKTS